MVSQTSIDGIIFSIIVSVLFPLAWFIGLRVKSGKFHGRGLWVGALTFFLFSQLLEKLLHLYVLKVNPITAHIQQHPIWFALYGALAAGVFEEGGRFLAMRYWMGRQHRYADGIAYGIGHGGLESLLVGAIGAIQTLTFAMLLNHGQWSMLSQRLPVSQLDALHHSLVSSTPILFALGGVERMAGLLIQLGLSLFMLYGIRKNIRFIALWAMLLHALVDFLPGLSQAMTVPTWMVECVVWVCALVALYWVVRVRRMLAE